MPPRSFYKKISIIETIVTNCYSDIEWLVSYDKIVYILIGLAVPRD